MSITQTCLAITALALAAHACGAQQSVPVKRRMPNQSVYVELGGNAGLLSLNYDRKLNSHFTARVGYGTWRSLAFMSDQPTSFARLQIATINYLAQDSGGGPHWLEIGTGAVIGESWNEMQPDARTRIVSATWTLGYRLMLGHGVFRIGLAEQYAIRGDFPTPRLSFRPGASLGVAF